jgi:hypothetical protein
MNSSLARRLALPLLAATLACGAAAPAQAAEISVSSPCVRYYPGLAGQEFVPVQGAGFTATTDVSFPNSVSFAYSGGDTGGSVDVTTAGTLAPGAAIFMPSDFISSSSGRTKSYTLTATDNANPAVTASTTVKFIRMGATTKPKRVRGNVHRRVVWKVWGATSGAKIYAHWLFRGKKRATRSLGRAKGACGIVKKRVPFLPARTRFGDWRVYFTVGRGFSRKEFPYAVTLDISRILGPGRAAAASARAGAAGSARSVGVR